MILMNKFIRIYSYLPYVIFMLTFRVLLLEEEKLANAKNISYDEDGNSDTIDFGNHILKDGSSGAELGEIYIAVVYPKSKETLFNRVVKQTMTSLSEEFAAATKLRVVPFYTVIGDTDGYSVMDVQKACDAWNHKPIVAALVLSSFRSGFAHVLTSLHNNIPVLWATGEVQAGYFERVPLSRFEIRLDPGSYEVLRSLRSLLLATHWHAFTIMHTTTTLASKVYKDIIDQRPLLPTILQFQPDSTSNYIFRLLSDVSKSTKGVIVLICEGVDAKRVIEESKKLNMVNGDFVWLWIDTGAMLVKERSVKLERISKESNFVVEMRKVRHIPNLFVDENLINSTTTTSRSTISYRNGSNVSGNRYKKSCKTRDNNLVASNTPICNSNSNRSTLYENKTEPPKPKLILPVTNSTTSNEILPNHTPKMASISALMKHHFSLYRKKSWRMVKDDKYFKQRDDKSSTRTPIRLKQTDAGNEEPNGTSTLSVINEETNPLSGGLINATASSGVDVRKGSSFERNLSTAKRKRNDKYLNHSITSLSLFNLTDLYADDNESTDAIRELTEDVLKKRISQNVSETTIQYDSVTKYEVPLFLENTSTPLLKNKTLPEMPVGVLALQLLPAKVDKSYVRSSLKVLIGTLKDVIVRRADLKLPNMLDFPRISCFDFSPDIHHHGPISTMDEFVHNLKQSVREALAGRTKFNDTHFEELQNSSLTAKFKILNLVSEENIAHNKSGLNLSKVKKVNATAKESRKWRTIGSMTGEESVHLETIVWPGGDIIPVSTGRGSRSIFRIVTAFAPPFVMIGELDEDGQCLRGIECHQFLTSDKDNLTLLFNEMERNEEEIEVNVLDRIQAETKHIWDGIDDIRSHHFGQQFKTNCCYGLSMDLLENVAEELEFDFQLYIVADGLFGSRTFAGNGEIKWNGIMGDLISGAAHMSFSPLSVSSSRSEFIDFSVPYFFSGVSFLAAPKASTDIPLLAFLLPFSANLWIAIFTSLNVTAIAVAIYEWLSPFGLNPWGRQRSKNFGIASAYWVLWALLCGHLIQFKAPKSWPNKFLINIWGGFSVIYIASYTANIAALIAGLFFHTAVVDQRLLSQRVGAPKSSAAEYYIRTTDPMLWDHMQRYSVISVAEGVQLLKNGSLDVLIADTPILDYYRATDHKCKLQKVGYTINEDTYAIGMTKGFPLKDSISAVIAKYSSNGYMDILQEKWYGGLPCFKLDTDMAQPRPLGVAAVAGVFLMLGLGVLIGCLILLSEHLFYKYTLPSLRKKPKSSIWKSRNVMFFSQKLYRFINCVELVSPHHAARELVHTLKQGQITSLFQKSVRRKEHEQRRQQQKSKTQFFEMIQEIRRVQQEERKSSYRFEGGKMSPRKKYGKNQQILLSPTGLLKHRSRLSPGRLDFARRFSKDVFRSKSSGNLEISRLGSDVSISTGRIVDFNGAQAIGRRLSHGTNDNSPPDLSTRRASQFLRDDSHPEVSPCGSDLSDFNAAAKCIGSPPSDTNLIRSPNVASSSTSSHAHSPRRSSGSIFSRDIGPFAARKFSNVDSSSFKGCKSKAQPKFCAPKLTLNNEDYLACEGGNCHEPTNELENEYYRDNVTRTGSVKSNEHIIQIVIPSDSEETATESRHDQPTSAFRRYSSGLDYRRSAADQSASVYDEVGDDSKPKIIMHLPKKKKQSTTNSESCQEAEHDTTPLNRLSVNELLSLAQLSETQLKESLLKAIAEKNPT